MPNVETLQKISKFLNIPEEKIYINEEKVISNIEIFNKNKI